MPASPPNPEPRTPNPKAAVLGWPIAHSLSPRLHTYWLNRHGIAGSYAAIAVEPAQLQATLKSLARQGYAGVNLTVPHKEAGLALMDALDPAAGRIGAVNTVLFRADGAMEGRNTDACGFSENLRASGVDLKNKPVVLLGAGGGARAVVVALTDMGVSEIRLINRTRAKAERLAQAFPDAHISLYDWNDARALKDAALLVNATSLGMRGQPALELSLDALPPAAAVADLVYAPLETDLLKRARAKGHKTVDGLGMLLHQARPAFAAFFGTDPEVTEDLRAYVLAKG